MTQESDKIKILFVDDDKVLNYLFNRSFGTDCDIKFASDAEAALDLMKENEFHTVFSDHHLPGMNGIEFLKIVRKEYPGILRVFLTGSEDESLRFKAEEECGILGFISKPWNEVEVISVLDVIEEELKKRK